MASDYLSIRAENERRYGTDIGRIGPQLLANRYDERMHFIFELLQNAEDALARRGRWSGRRAVEFSLSREKLQISHYGIPFTELDVRSICGILDSTKDETLIGRFGIGFKSVYALTACPEIHSGDEHFAIDSFVWPRAIPAIESDLERTTFFLPFREDDPIAFDEIAAGLRKLDPRTLLFLKNIEEVSWSIENGNSGLYLRGPAEAIGKNLRKVIVIGQEHGAEEIVEETWLVFSEEVCTDEGKIVGYVEIAFRLVETDEGDSSVVEPLDASTLVVYFPTIVTTNLGFLVQGPYRTTPSRDNVPRIDSWNQELVRKTANLLVDSLRSLRDRNSLDLGVLSSLPLDRSKFPEGNMFAPLFEAVRKALISEPLLPCFGGGHVSAKNAKLARTQELRELFDSKHLSTLFHVDNEISWLSEEITQARTSELRDYLRLELNVEEVLPETIIAKLTKDFLEAQTDDWIVRLYEFLNGQAALLRQGKMHIIPLVRLENGTHVLPRKDGQPQAFLPGSVLTDFPTVKSEVCVSDGARVFLKNLGLTEPDPVDDVIWNVLPRYDAEPSDIKDYGADIRRILKAFGTDSNSQREKLLTALRDSHFVMSVDGSGKKRRSKPAQVYLATQRFKEIFDGVTGVYLVDDTNTYLRGEEIRGLLEACGATRSLQPIPTETNFTLEERREMRRLGGCESCAWEYKIEDFTLRGLDALLDKLGLFDTESAARRAMVLWDALCDVEERRGSSAFLGTYRWSFHEIRRYDFDAAFVRCLRNAAWVPSRDGTLQPPEFVIFGETGWKENPFLLSKFRFKPPVIEALAREAGIEPGLLDLLKRLGMTKEAELRARLGIVGEGTIDEEVKSSEGLGAEEAVKKLLGEGAEPTAPKEEESRDILPGSGGRGGKGAGTTPSGGGIGGVSGSREGTGNKHGGGAHPRPPGSTGGRPFISYIGAHPNTEDRDPDGLDHARRMELEEQAIALILASESELQRMSTNNPGYDLFEPGSDGHPIRWIEVKAMTGDFHGRPVGMSKTQFESAIKHGEAYWLYVVEHASNPGQARIIRIQDPAGKARTFTFDHGWLGIAEVDEPAKQDREEQTVEG